MGWGADRQRHAVARAEHVAPAEANAPGGGAHSGEPRHRSGGKGKAIEAPAGADRGNPARIGRLPIPRQRPGVNGAIAAFSGELAGQGGAPQQGALAIAGVGGGEVPPGTGVGHLHGVRLAARGREEPPLPGRTIVCQGSHGGIGDREAPQAACGLPPGPKASAHPPAVGPSRPCALKQLQDWGVIGDAGPHRQQVALHQAAARSETNLRPQGKLKVGPVHRHQVAAAGGDVGSAEGLFKGEIQPAERRGGIGEKSRGAKVATAQPHPKQVLPREARVDGEPGVVVDREGIEEGEARSCVGAPIHRVAFVAKGSHHRVHLHPDGGGGDESLELLGGGEGLQLLDAVGGGLGLEGLGVQRGGTTDCQAKASEGIESPAGSNSSTEMGSRWRHRCLKARGQNATTAPAAYPRRPILERMPHLEGQGESAASGILAR